MLLETFKLVCSYILAVSITLPYQNVTLELRN